MANPARKTFEKGRKSLPLKQQERPTLLGKILILKATILCAKGRTKSHEKTCLNRDDKIY
jgi:hypothetical protein